MHQGYRPGDNRRVTSFADLVLPDGARIVHIGPPKTGTSALQGAFFAARAEAAAQGVLYASEGKHGMSAVLAAMDLPSPWSAARKPPPRWRWSRLLGLIKASSAPRVLLSSEFFADGKPDAIRRVIDELDPQRVQIVVTLRPLEALALNEIGRVRLRATQPLFVDPYSDNRQTGSFILVDERSNKTVAAGVIGRATLAS